MIAALLKRWKAFCAHNKGGVLILVALSLLPMLLMMGLAVDSSYGLAQKRKLQMACDAAAKAGMANGQGQLTTITTEAKKIFTVNTINMSGISGPNVSVDASGNITVSASINVPTTFMKLGGINSTSYSATSTVPNGSLGQVFEIAIAIDVSRRSTQGGFLDALILLLPSFINGLPKNAAISIVPYSTNVQFDSSTTVSSALFNKLSPSATDEISSPAMFPISNYYPWNSVSFSTVYNFFYGTSFPNETSYYPLPGICPSGKLACSTLYPGNCPGGWQSCTSNYSYFMYPNIPVLPLTTNKTIINDYINSLQNINPGNNGELASLISWAWRTIAPEWNDFFQVNSLGTTTNRTTGTYPKAYNQTTPKSLIIIASGDAYWDDMKNSANFYTTACGASSATWTANCKSGFPCVNQQTWLMTNYGIAPLTKNLIARNDGTCANYDYDTIDKSFGLNLASNDFLDTIRDANGYTTAILNEVQNKVNRICANIQSTGINIYVIAAGTTTDFNSCTTNSNIYPMKKASKLSSALASISAKIISGQPNVVW